MLVIIIVIECIATIENNQYFTQINMSSYRDLSATGSREEFQHMTNETYVIDTLMILIESVEDAFILILLLCSSVNRRPLRRILMYEDLLAPAPHSLLLSLKSPTSIS